MGKDGKKTKENVGGPSLVPCVCKSLFLPLVLSFPYFSHIVAHSVDKDGGPLSLVGRLSKRDSAREAELCDATAAVTWLCRSSDSLAGPVCDLTFVTAAATAENTYRRTQQEAAEDGKAHPNHFSCLARQQRRLSRSLGQWGWETGLAYMQNDSQSFSLSYRPRDKAQFDNNKLVPFLEQWCIRFLRRARGKILNRQDPESLPPFSSVLLYKKKKKLGTTIIRMLLILYMNFYSEVEKLIF